MGDKTVIRDMGASGGVLSVTVGFLGVSADVPGPCRTMRTLWETMWMDIYGSGLIQIGPFLLSGLHGV